MLPYTLLKGHSDPLCVGAPEASAEEGNVVDRVKAVATKTTNSTGINNLRMFHLQERVPQYYIFKLLESIAGIKPLRAFSLSL